MRRIVPLLSVVCLSAINYGNIKIQFSNALAYILLNVRRISEKNLSFKKY
jgi:hypothetical protein